MKCQLELCESGLRLPDEQCYTGPNSGLSAFRIGAMRPTYQISWNDV